MTAAAVYAQGLIDAFAGAPDSAAAARRLYAALAPLSPLSLNHQDTVSGREEPGWPTLAFLRPASFDSGPEGAIVLRTNPLPETSIRLRRPYAWREARFADARTAGAYWEALRSFGFRDGLSVPGFDGRALSCGVTLSFGADGFDPATRAGVVMACAALMAEARWRSAPRPRLTARERDCIAWVAEGKTDWEISRILSIGEATAHGYVESAKRKLGATTRPEAAGRWLAFERGRPEVEAPAAGLSPREEQVLLWIAAGWTDKHVAARLEISPATVRDHVDAARAKLNAATRAHAVAKLVAARA